LAVGGHLEHGLHVAEGGAEDQLVALAGHVAEHALGVGRLGHLLDEAGHHLVAELLLDALRPLSCAKVQPPSPTGPT
jgi:hypothetical protein